MIFQWSFALYILFSGVSYDDDVDEIVLLLLQNQEFSKPYNFDNNYALLNYLLTLRTLETL
jgi:hypothetical protein